MSNYLTFYDYSEAKEYARNQELEGYNTKIVRHRGRRIEYRVFLSPSGTVISPKKRIVAEMEMLRKKSQEEEVPGISIKHIDRYLELKNKLGEYSGAHSAASGEPIVIKAATRVGSPEGKFFSDKAEKAFGGKDKTVSFKDLKFSNPAVYEDQWEAIEDLFGLRERELLGEKYNELKEKIGFSQRYSRFEELTSHEEIVSFWAKIDSRIASEIAKKGHDGIIYHHGKKPGEGEYTELEEEKPKEEVEEEKYEE